MRPGSPGGASQVIVYPVIWLSIDFLGDILFGERLVAGGRYRRLMLLSLSRVDLLQKSMTVDDTFCRLTPRKRAKSRPTAPVRR
jgi:hypothetical protein